MQKAELPKIEDTRSKLEPDHRRYNRQYVYVMSTLITGCRDGGRTQAPRKQDLDDSRIWACHGLTRAARRRGHLIHLIT